MKNLMNQRRHNLSIQQVLRCMAWEEEGRTVFEGDACTWTLQRGRITNAGGVEIIRTTYGGEPTLKDEAIERVIAKAGERVATHRPDLEGDALLSQQAFVSWFEILKWEV